MSFRLKKLEISGFKSFAKPAQFDFSRPITAVVGPNGSGKSNVAESIRWVLGEQSLKSLRGKKGEDLIFNGSQSAPRLGKASVALHFDNSKKQFPIEFDEVVIGRRIYRDGQSEYLLNDSNVRLKDIVELLGNVGLGVSQHHIIGQGEADRILYSSPKERQQAIEDALGLKIYQFKRIEAERKLSRTEENMRQAQALQKEIKPHLKHLERMVERFRQASDIKIELEKKMNEYLSALRFTLDLSVLELAQKKEQPVKELELSEKKIAELKKKLATFEKFEEEPKEIKELETELILIREKKSKIDRDLGRLEGMIEAESAFSASDEGAVIPREEVEDLIANIDDSLSSALDTDVVDEIYMIIREALSRLGSFLGGLEVRGGDRPKNDDLIKKRTALSDELANLIESEKKIHKKRDELGTAFYAASRERRTAEKELFDLETKANSLRNMAGNLAVEEEKIKMRESEFTRDLEEAERFLGPGKINFGPSDKLSDSEREKSRREVDRLKFKLEEAGGVDPAIVKEYEEIKGRDEFFVRELDDLGGAAKSLRQISKELGEKIDHDFSGGIEKINKEFQIFFETMFGGGRARLEVVKPEKRRQEDAENENEEEDLSVEIRQSAADGGVDIDVALPRKKIKGLDMLSGGERALTSIALLFAMSAVNPPPFLVLDETDAALDESNSRRYGAMLKNLSATTQIITITHNRETMRQAGALYGVTMGSDGVSRLLSLKLSEAEEIAQ